MYRVEGLRELLRVTDQLPKETKKGVRDELRKVAEPARDRAQSLFLSRVSPIPRQTRYGISVRATGTVSIEQRVKARTGNPARKRRNFTDLQWRRVLDPVSDETRGDLDDAMDNVLERLERKWLLS